MIVRRQKLEIRGAGASEMPKYPVRALIIVVRAISDLVCAQLSYKRFTRRGTGCLSRHRQLEDGPRGGAAPRIFSPSR